MPGWVPLSRLMRTSRPGHAVVAQALDHVYRWDDFQTHVAGLCEELKVQPAGRWLLSCESSYAFAVGLLALWHSGRIAVLAPNQQPDSLRESALGVEGVISDGAPAIPKMPILMPLARLEKAGSWDVLDSSTLALELFTSGSTGQRQAVGKTRKQLERELETLGKTFGSRLADCRVYATVSHQHIYGLLFRLLWPLCAGRPFADKTFLFWEEFYVPENTAVCLVTSPAHLERLASVGENTLRKVAPRLIFSSGGPLRAASAEAVRGMLAQSLIEVFGSTETGGVGWRSESEGLWQPFEGVTVSAGEAGDGRLSVKSSFAPSEEELVMGDRGHVEPDGRFRISGRADRVVKVAEKRLSLDDMERRLLEHKSVTAARVILLEAQEGRAVLGAVVVLSAEGREEETKSRAALTAVLRMHLQKSFDASTLPRAFRFVDALPVDAMGKVSQAVLAPLFQKEFQPSVTAPEVLAKTEETARLAHRLRVPETLAYLEGHFPGYSIVPGVVQVQWVVEAVTPWLGRPPIIQRMDALKFKKPLLPGQEFSLVVERDPMRADKLLRFSLMDGETLFSSGRMAFA